MGIHNRAQGNIQRVFDDLIWVTLPNGVEMSYSYCLTSEKMLAHLNIQGIPNFLPYGECRDMGDGNRKLNEVTVDLAQEHFNEIMNWSTNKGITLDCIQ